MNDTSLFSLGDIMNQGDATMEIDTVYDENQPKLSYNKIAKNKDMEDIKQVRLRQKFIE